MKNVTVSIKEGVADWESIEAARRDTSVWRLIGEMLAEKMRHDDAYERAMNEWLGRNLGWKSDGTPYSTREETNDLSLR